MGCHGFERHFPDAHCVHLSSIPAGYGPKVAKASLKLFVNAVNSPGTFNVVYVNAAWSESTITYNLSPALGTQIATSPEVALSSAEDYVIVDVTSAVQARLENSEPNDGLALVANNPLSATFDSKENTSESHPPELDIVFAPGVGTITGITTGTGSGLEGGAASGSPSLSLIPCTSIGEILSWTAAGWACSPMSLSNEFVPLTGGTMTGILSVPTLTGSGGGGNLSITSPLNINMKSNVAMTLSAGSSLTVSSPIVNFSSSQVILGFTTASSLFAGSINSASVFLQPAGISPTVPLNSSPLVFQGVSTSNTNYAAEPFFQWQLEPAGIGSANPSGTFNLLYGPD